MLSIAVTSDTPTSRADRHRLPYMGDGGVAACDRRGGEKQSSGAVKRREESDVGTWPPLVRTLCSSPARATAPLCLAGECVSGRTKPAPALAGRTSADRRSGNPGALRLWLCVPLEIR
ncbi:hypothetical protein AAFF_G00325600 [Aldrovandia affinis]|uniref:Uncharacterized protein n=1 Tax=Aldrovandia affinis TaxID=143900 RepID=A0AAD7X177_9TELE|nr:hypothetical protein AAFF_G00325600 [Aldrovandia affinis]